MYTLAIFVLPASKKANKICPVNCLPANQTPATLTFLFCILCLQFWFLLPSPLFLHVFTLSSYSSLIINTLIPVQASPLRGTSPPDPGPPYPTYPPTCPSLTQGPTLLRTLFLCSHLITSPPLSLPSKMEDHKAGTLFAMLSVESEAEWVLDKYLWNK